MDDEIKPVYQSKAEHVDWYNISKDVFDILTKDGFETRILYPSAAYEALQKENAELAWMKNNSERLAIKSAEHATKAVSDLKAENAAQAKRIAHLEYKIDELMLEWCPDEMTPEQLENYAKHQRRVSL